VAVRFDQAGRPRALATIFRDDESLAFEVGQEERISERRARPGA
jgi:hypothetical protein